MGGIAKGLGKIAGPLAGGAAGFALGGPVGAGLGLMAGGALGGGPADKLFGNNIPNSLQNPRLTSFNSPGLNAQFASPTQLNMTRGAGVESALGGVSAAFGNQASELGALRSLVEPGMGRLTEAGINAIRDSRRASMGDLRQNLARRRVGGSSFAADDLSRTSAEFAKRENEFASQAFMQELGLTQDLINQQANAQVNSYLQTLNQSNIESGLAAQMATGVSSMLQGNAQMMGQLSNSGADRLLNVGGALAGGFMGRAPSQQSQGGGMNLLSSNPWQNPLVGGPRKLS